MSAFGLNNTLRLRHLAPGFPQPSSYSDFPSLQGTLSFISAEFTDFQLGGGGLDPIFGSGFLYDVHGQRRISETFHFDTNPDALLSLLNGSGGAQQQQHREWISTARNFLFRITRKRTVHATLSSTLGNFLTTASSNTNFSLVDRARGTASGEKYIKNVSESDEDAGKSSEVLLHELRLSGDRPVTSCAQEACCASGVFLVIRVEKVLQQGDANDISELYGKDDKASNILIESEKLTDEELGRYLAEIHRQTTANLVVTRFSSYSATHSPGSTDQEADAQESTTVGSPSVLPTLLDPNNSVIRRLKLFPNLELTVRLSSASPLSVMPLLKSSAQTVGASKELLKTIHPTTTRSRPLLNPESMPYIGSFFHGHPELTSVTTNVGIRVSQRNSLTMVDTSKSATLIRPMRDVLELPSRNRIVPYTNIRNLLYIYPRSVVFPASRQGSRNIAVRIQLIHEEESVHKVLPNIFGKSNSTGFVSEAFTTVLYHNRCPEWWDEIKVQLPEHLDSNYYILFTFFHVSCQNKKVESNAVLDMVIGYSWLPVLHEGTLCDTDVTLLISTIKPTPALTKLRPDMNVMTDKFYMDAFKWVDSTRELFRVSTIIVSSVYPQDVNVEFLLSSCRPHKVLHTLRSLMVRESITQLGECIHNARIYQLIAFLAPIMDGLLRLVLTGLACRVSVTSSNNNITDLSVFSALHLLVQFVDHVSTAFPDWCDAFGRNRLFVAYLAGPRAVAEDFVLWMELCGVPLFGIPLAKDLLQQTMEGDYTENMCLPQELLRLFRPPPDSNSINRLGLIPLKSWWFLLELWIRLLVQHLMHPDPKMGMKKEAVVELTDMPDSLLAELSIFIRNLTVQIVSTILYQGEKRNYAQIGKERSVAVFALKHFNTYTFRRMSVAHVDYKPLITMVKKPLNAAPRRLQWMLIRLQRYDCELVCQPGDRLHIADTPSGAVANDAKFETIASVDYRMIPKIDDHIRQLISKSNVAADASKLEALLFCKLDLLQIVCTHENHLSVTNITFPIRDLLEGLFYTVNGLVRYSPGDSNLSDGMLMTCTAPRGSEHEHLLINILSHLVLSVLANGLNVNLPKVHWQASSLLCSLLAFHEADPRLSSTVRKQLQKSHIVHSLSAIACLYIGLLDLLEALVRRIVGSWRAFVIQNDFPAHFQRPISSRSFVDDGSDKASVSSVEVIPSKSQSGKRRATSVSHTCPAAYGSDQAVTVTEAKRRLRLSIVTSGLRCPLVVQLVSGVRQRAGSTSRVPSQPTGFQPSAGVAVRVDTDRTSVESQQSLQQQRQYNSNLSLRPDDASVPSWLANTSTLAVTSILERITTILWDLDCSQGLPGLSLFASIQSEFDQLIPYRKPNCDLGNTTTLLDTISRVLLFALSLDQSAAAYCQLLRCLKQMMEKFPNFVFEDNPHWLSAFLYHLLALCALDSHAVRSQASLLLFHVMRSHYMLNKNLSQIRSNLYAAFAPLYTPNQHQEDLHPNRLKYIPFLQRHVNLKDSLRNLRAFVDEDATSTAFAHRSIICQSVSDLKEESLSSMRRSVSSPIFQAIENDGLLNFSAQITRLVENLCELSEDATRMQMKISSSHVHTKSPVDSEYILSLIDTLYSMADRCRLSPEMRLYWLLQIMERHNTVRLT
ncbi:dedicator of cytokinesis protein 6/7/8 [Paragonimus westermani]|uniref:Dedicator of cytokinesis protein 6/7/8 n=1 Tax=Paragonimus westermani TaxID=34504 RepID=A0A5J4NCP6_9TREM|nr:dedicator of cytokinesis protein 6/7/8 [Paragonimus westermani]